MDPGEVRPLAPTGYPLLNPWAAVARRPLPPSVAFLIAVENRTFRNYFRFMGSLHDFKIAHWDHEPAGGASVLASRLVSSLAPPQRGSARSEALDLSVHGRGDSSCSLIRTGGRMNPFSFVAHRTKTAVSQGWSTIGLIEECLALSGSPQQHENKQNDEHQTKSAAGIIPPALAVRPGRERPEKQEKQYNY